ncbi:TPA: quinohemoprotein amine dehydrogenase subunit beta [Pseudomonas aeruginosa]|jgi:quinohemoprotein amine dehydrogenase beta subunit|uniref:quinohemoprotein amine dehydrogenase subunit beta n=1 Tax=Pseudomonas aeruginosa TaxID=287 RepID=UPI00044EA37A|nr:MULTISPECIES: quinohemoprotein amine dehydrogenase subunit beta [Pseudomonadaceae]EKY0786011.1 quinohemoprotein amine dehydrogenase subunit beta [Pseudomonas aeruginosa]ETU80187.1 quinohemoprotein amine dehydrogenase, beta subunit [Pseudomonas aeruginosa PS50]KJS74255.1 MAG: quinohemoprotein amine dehydrogenase [[Pseudomonas] sp. BICA1-14]MCS9193016.1 quinohemoprotein amine dehydrogenase subunit beta [Pseudomonas aeruginosa]HBO8978889.1 quinohemoprotein amine dehydrogenase subunit beta [Pse
MSFKHSGSLAAAFAMLATSWSVTALAETGPALQPGHEYMVVSNYPNNLHLVDIQTDKLYKTCTLPDAYGPGTVQMAPDKKTAYILNNHYADIYGVDLDSCKLVFHAALAQQPGERARSMFAIAVSPDGKEIYSVANPTKMGLDNYVVQAPRLQVYAADGGLQAKPLRSFPAPRQVTVMQTGADGALYMAGADIYKVDVHTGKVDVAVPSRSWKRPLYSPPDVLYAWPQQTPSGDFTILYTTVKFKDEKQDMATAEFIYGFFNIDLATGKSETVDFAPLTEIYFSAMRSPKDQNLIYGVLNRLTKYDIKQKKLLEVGELDHSYYCVALNKAGNKVYLTGTFNDVAVYDADSLKKLSNIKLPGGDMAIATSQIFTR